VGVLVVADNPVQEIVILAVPEIVVEVVVGAIVNSSMNQLPKKIHRKGLVYL
jgi:hypothetical protein